RVLFRSRYKPYSECNTSQSPGVLAIASAMCKIAEGKPDSDGHSEESRNQNDDAACVASLVRIGWRTVWSCPRRDQSEVHRLAVPRCRFYVQGTPALRPGPVPCRP